jgi:hypothetical protein
MDFSRSFAMLLVRVGPGIFHQAGLGHFSVSPQDGIPPVLACGGDYEMKWKARITV